MTDELDPIPDEAELEKAKEAAAIPPEPVPDTEGLPDDTKDGNAEDDGSTPPHEGEPE